MGIDTTFRKRVGNDLITVSWRQDGRIESDIGMNRWPRRERSPDEILLGKYNDEGDEVHHGTILATGGKSPHMLDEGGEQVHHGTILATGGKSPHMLDEGGGEVHLGSILATGDKSPHMLDEGGIHPSSSAWPSNLMEAIKAIASSECPCPSESKFCFELSRKQR